MTRRHPIPTRTDTRLPLRTLFRSVLIARICLIQPFFGISYSIHAFFVVTAAGFGNLPGVILAGFGLGVAEQFGSFIFGAEFQQATVVGMLVLVRIWRQILENRHRQVVE